MEFARPFNPQSRKAPLAMSTSFATVFMLRAVPAWAARILNLDETMPSP